ncbi:MAG: 16S rRNA (cytosine(967)-C(5))-methyltransferase RsmB [Clostridiaceae bacterium]|nr:16S rRNA (cytosine(967)-C(5))-methyltransferase RsmB [Clostridiaceae bacterium]
MKSARQTAFEILNKIQRDNSYSNLALDHALDKADTDNKDKKFVSALVYGVTERRITLDYNLSLYLSQPIKKLKPEVLTALRLGAYQILFMDKIPVSAAVNESVKLAKKNGAAFASGLVNAVLRKIISNGLKTDGSMSVNYSAPEWLCDMWCKSYGRENAEKLLEASFGAVDTVLRVNTEKIDADNLINLLAEEGFVCETGGNVENSAVVKSGGAVHKTEAYKNGLFHVQDAASQLCCKALGVQENETVIDICAAPGGKSFTLAENMKNTGRIISCDIYEHRLKLISDGAERLGLTNIETVRNDGNVFNPEFSLADKILCDVPCSGLGVIRKKPEIRFKKSEEVDKLQDLQYSIMCISSRYLKIGGVMVYSTCSLNPNENEKIVEKFLTEHDNFEGVRVLSDISRYGVDTDYLTLMPHIHGCDGFFISAVRRIK